MRTNRGTARQEDTTPSLDRLVLVQAKDADGFWCNVIEGLPVKSALKSAARHAEAEGVTTRVVTGAKRDIVRVFGA